MKIPEFTKFNALITGASSGIGLETLKLFSKTCDVIFACIQFPTDDYEKFLDTIEEKYVCKIITVSFDFENLDEIKRAFLEIKSYKLPIHSVINIAGMTKDNIFEMTSINDLKQVMDINFTNQLIFNQYLLRLLKSNKDSRIVFVSSVSALDGNLGQVAYASSKGAIISATKTLARELAIHGINVNCVAPGYIDTRMTKQLEEKLLTEMVSRTSLGRIGLAEEVAGAILFLSSNLSTHVTGQIIRVDGGL